MKIIVNWGTNILVTKFIFAYENGRFALVVIETHISSIYMMHNNRNVLASLVIICNQMKTILKFR